MQKDLSPYLSESIFESLDDETKLKHWQNLANQIAHHFSAASVLINQADEKGIEVIASSENSENPYSKGTTIGLSTNIYCHQTVQENQKLYIQDATLDSKWEDNPELTNDNMVSYLGMPLHWPDGRVFGTLCVMDIKVSDYNDSLITVLTGYREIIEFELKLIASNRQLKALSLIDPLTGLYNKRGLSEASKKLLSIASRQNLSVSVLYLDINNLKEVNDDHGHDAGDQLIEATASVLKTVVRKHDISVRLGGDEFLLVTLQESKNDLKLLVDRILNACEQKNVRVNDKFYSLSLSIGTSRGNVSGYDCLCDLIKEADQEMYKFKNNLK